MTRRGHIPRLGDGTVARLGRDVYDVADPRHIGVLVAIESSVRGIVRWHDTGWKSNVPLDDLRAVSAAENGVWF
ncbi:MAG: hypothetical protein J2P55_16700 [Rhizobiales bacterium]|nr:hypothetical protein [Hyphomicrobiales bacterium]